MASLLPSVLATAAAAPYLIDPEASRATIHVDRSGLFSFLGHAHEIDAPVADGSIAVNPDDLAQSTLQVVFDASTLKVTGTGEPAADVAEVQQTLDSERVLDVARFPRIIFTSTRIEPGRVTGNRRRIRVAGTLTLHGVAHPETTEIWLELAPERLTATGVLTVKQTDFGIRPVTAGGGSVRVKDEVEIAFTLVARPDMTARP